MNLSKVRREQMSPQMLLVDFLMSYTFVDIGNIQDISDDNKRIDVLLPYKNPDKSDLIIEGVELLQQGTSKVKIEILPNVGDSVLVFCPRHQMIETEHNHKNEVYPAGYYNQAGMKAILIQGKYGESPSASIEINKDGDVTINGHLKVAKI